jgi:hypothetical protein
MGAAKLFDEPETCFRVDLLGIVFLSDPHKQRSSGSGRCEQRKMGIGARSKNDITDVSAKAIADCKAKGGVDPKIVWSVWTNIWGTTWKICPGAVAVSDNGNGTIVGWHFGHSQNHRLAKNDCLKKGGQHPKVVDIRN